MDERRDQRPDRPDHRDLRAQGGPAVRTLLARLVDKWGWRAVAIPVLAIATVWWAGTALAGDNRSASSPGRPSAPAHTAGPVSPTASVPGAARVTGTSAAAASRRPSASLSAGPSAGPSTSRTGPSNRPSVSVAPTSAGTSPPSSRPASTGSLSQGQLYALPAGAPFAVQGTGTFTVVPGRSKQFGIGPLHTFAVAAENGTDVGRGAFATAVTATLADPRSWGHAGLASFRRVGSGPVDFTVALTSAVTERAVCGYELKVETSCFSPATRTVYINDSRWVRGAVAYAGDVAAYQRYVVNHEVGHALGYHHMKCPATGSPAPLMMEQTLGTASDAKTCRPNPWPYVGGKLITGPPTTGY